MNAFIIYKYFIFTFIVLNFIKSNGIGRHYKKKH